DRGHSARRARARGGRRCRPRGSGGRGGAPGAGKTHPPSTFVSQTYFRLYKRLPGMPGTADTEAGEFHEIYKLDVTVIPTNKPMVRLDNPDLVYKNEKGKFRAVIDEVV